MTRDDGIAGQIRMIGCCGAYCGTCLPLKNGTCRGCKLGYDEGKRAIRDARCKMKVCCFQERALETCADCPGYHGCTILRDFHAKKGYKYRKYQQSLAFIRDNGYAEFLKKAVTWKCAYGNLE